MNEYLTKNVVLEPVDFNIVKETADKRGLGRKGFSAALRRESDGSPRAEAQAICCLPPEDQSGPELRAFRSLLTILPS